jgi:transposase
VTGITDTEEQNPDRHRAPAREQSMIRATSHGRRTRPLPAALACRQDTGRPYRERRQRLVASFASRVAKDEAAVRAAISLPWSNGQTEGQITKLKLVKRQMYGRAKIDLLQAGLIGAIRFAPNLRQSPDRGPIDTQPLRHDAPHRSVVA